MAELLFVKRTLDNFNLCLQGKRVMDCFNGCLWYSFPMLKFLMQSLFLSLGFVFFSAQGMAQIKNEIEEKAIAIELLSNKAEIVLEKESTSEGTLLVGVQIEAESGWHFYWAGLGTEILEPTIIWDLPEGFSVEAVNHPNPSLFDYGGFMGYGFEGRTVFLYRLVGDNARFANYALGDVLQVTANVEWLLCKDVCIFGSETASLDWRVSAVEKLTEEHEWLNSLFERKELKQNQTLENRFIEMGVLGWIMAAFLGGVILNLMPCVLPVLSIKVLSLIEHAGSRSSQRFIHGLMYSMGVILSFIVLAIILMGLRSLGEEVGWGFQLQNPFFITFLIALFFLLGLNMLGVYEMGSSLARLSNATISNRADWVGSFATGILAAVVGAPCVGPFIGGVSGIALQVDVGLGVLIFALIGFGMAFPFLLLSWAPGLLKFLPKPGIWMIRFRQAMGVLLILSTAFLVYVVDQSVGIHGVLLILGILFFILLASYLFGRWGRITESKQIQRQAMLVSFLLILVPGFFGSQNLARLYDEVALETPSYEDGIWEKWSKESVENALDLEQGVFIDFTASWCLICQSNKALVLRKKKTESLFKQYGIRLFVADWTQNDPEITRALESYGRSGVPLYVLKSPDGREQILPQNLSYPLLETAVEGLFSAE